MTDKRDLVKVGLTLKNVGKALLDILYGATIYEMVRDLNKEKGHLEHLFVLVVFGDFLGVPKLSPLLHDALAALCGPQDCELEIEHAARKRYH